MKLSLCWDSKCLIRLLIFLHALGIFQCGPASVRAIKEGDVDLDYDTLFVFTEVNADCNQWIVYKDGTKKKVYCDTERIGKAISTKAMGSNSRVDVTNNYKYPEGKGKLSQWISSWVLGTGGLGLVAYFGLITSLLHLEQYSWQYCFQTCFIKQWVPHSWCVLDGIFSKKCTGQYSAVHRFIGTFCHPKQTSN